MSASTVVAHNLPPQPTPFVGRHDELAEIARLLADPACRLLTLTGPGGIGKTRLALEAVTTVKDDFPDGVCFVSLAPVTSPAFVLSAICEALLLTLYSEKYMKQQLLNHLSIKHLLLVLDNYEHLLEDVDLLTEILGTVPHAKVLITSRERLNLREEWVFELQGLPFPASDDETDIEGYSAVQLFVHIARHTNVSFTLKEGHKPAVTRICRLVGGMPLGIELAAAWVRALSCDQIAGEIERSLDILETPARNVPQRHRTMRAVFDPTWTRLSDDEQAVFRKLSVFRGGFTREAADYVAGASLRTLSGLVDKSLLRVDTNGRYDIHELLRQYAEAKLVEASGAHDRHTVYYTDFLHKLEAKLKGPEQIAALDEIEAEIDNIRTAWQRASALRQEQALDKAIEGLALFYMMRSRAIEGERVFGQTLRDLGQVENALLAKVLLFLARYAATRDWDKAAELAQRGLSLWRTHVPPGEAAFALRLTQGTSFSAYINDQNLDELYQLSEANLKAYRDKSDPWGEAWALSCLAGLSHSVGKIVEAQHNLQDALSIFRLLGNPWAATFVLGDIAQLLMESGQYEEARKLIHEVQATNRTMGDLQGIIFACWELAEIAYIHGDNRNVKSYVREALQVALEIQSYPTWLLTFSPLIVHLLIKDGAIEQAVELATHSDAAFKHSTYWIGLVSVHQRVVEQLQVLQAELPSDVFATAKRRGETSNWEIFTRALLDRFFEEQPSPTTPAQLLADPLSARELEVLRLVAQGLSNREIARELVISLGTVKTHIHNICGKLDATSRMQAIARARYLNLI